MIVFIREAADGSSVRGFLPLCQSLDGAWQPIADEPFDTAEQALDACIHRLRFQVRVHDEDMVARRRCIDADLARLRDRPRSRDRVMIHGQVCTIDPDGSTVMPEAVLPAPPPRPPLSLSGIEVGDDLIEILRRAVRDPIDSRERVLALVGDVVGVDPYDLLLSVAETAPPETAARWVADVAVLLVSVSQRRGQKSQWHRITHAEGWDGDERSPGCAERFSGIVQQVIDDEAPAGDAARDRVAVRTEQDSDDHPDPSTPGGRR